MGEEVRIMITVRELQISDIIGRDCKSRQAVDFNIDYQSEFDCSIVMVY